VARSAISAHASSNDAPGLPGVFLVMGRFCLMTSFSTNRDSKEGGTSCPKTTTR
jgi:hypothetical protein